MTQKRKVWSVRVEDDDAISDIIEGLVREKADAVGVDPKLLRSHLELASLKFSADGSVEAYAIEPDPTGRATRVARFLREEFEGHMARAADQFVLS